MARVLILSPAFPLPLQSGGQVRLYQVIKYLAGKGHRVSLLSFLLPEHETQVEKIRALCHRVECVPGRLESSLAARVRGHLGPSGLRRLLAKARLFLGGAPYQYVRFAHPEMTRRLRRLMAAEDFDFVQAEYSQMASYLTDPAVRGSRARTLLVEIDVSFVAGERTVRQTRGLPRLLHRLDTARMRSYHRRVLPGVFRVVAMSEEDARILEGLYPEAVVCVAPNGVDVEEFPFSRGGSQARENLLFVGGSGHPPNVDAMEFFSRQILPLLQQEFPDLCLTVVGNFENRPGQYPPALRFPGFVDDLKPSLAGHAVSVVPLRIGSGTRLKILESFAAGIPVVSTRVGAEGIRAEHGRDILLADTPEDFSRAVVSLLRDPELANRIALGGRRTAVEVYAWDRVLSPLDLLYREAAPGGQDGRL